MIQEKRLYEGKIVICTKRLVAEGADSRRAFIFYPQEKYRVFDITGGDFRGLEVSGVDNPPAGYIPPEVDFWEYFRNDD